MLRNKTLRATLFSFTLLACAYAQDDTGGFYTGIVFYPKVEDGRIFRDSPMNPDFNVHESGSSLLSGTLPLEQNFNYRNPFDNMALVIGHESDSGISMDLAIRWTELNVHERPAIYTATDFEHLGEFESVEDFLNYMEEHSQSDGKVEMISLMGNMYFNLPGPTYFGFGGGAVRSNVHYSLDLHDIPVWRINSSDETKMGKIEFGLRFDPFRLGYELLFFDKSSYTNTAGLPPSDWGPFRKHMLTIGLFSFPFRD